MRTFICLLFWATVPALGFAADEWQLRGRVIDEAGKPVANAAVGHYWTANGNRIGSDGTRLGFSDKPEDLVEFWSHVGEMAPGGTSGVTTADDGSFVLNVHPRRHAVMAMDKERKRAAIVRIPKGEEGSPVEIKLAPSVRLKGKFEIAGQQALPYWTAVYLFLPKDNTRPTDEFRPAHCGSWNADFEFTLPPGKYSLHAYGESSRLTANNGLLDLKMSPDLEINLTGESAVHDLGTLKLQKREIEGREKEMVDAKAAGTWGDYKKHYGQPPPKWHITDARGANKDVSLADYRGKWVLLYLWGLPCPGCLADGLPKLMKFYGDHAEDRGKFEILAFCTDCDNNFQSIADLDRGLEPIIKEVWHGKTLPFPILFDPTFQTMKNYGVLGYGTLLLIDPNGNLVEGDEQTLAEHLKR